MKKILLTFLLLITTSAGAGIYTNNNFKPYIGANFGLNIAEYNYKTDLEDIYYSVSGNIGAKIGRNFGAELYFSQSATNNLEYIDDFSAVNHEFYYQSFGFNIFAYYGISKEFDFFTTFGVANYKTYYKNEQIGEYTQTDELTENDVTTKFGIGLIYTFPMDKVSALIQYQYSPVNNWLIGTLSEFSVGIRYTF